MCDAFTVLFLVFIPRKRYNDVCDELWKYYISFVFKVRQHERLFGVLLAHEIETATASMGTEGERGEWEGELCSAAQTLLHQHAIQGDLSPLQATIARFAAVCRLNNEVPIDPKCVLH